MYKGENKRPGVGVSVIIINEQDEVLISKRINPGTFEHDTWQVAGGHLEFGESFEECAQRELEEETGALIRNKSDIVYITTVNCIDIKNNYHYLDIFMAALVDKETFKPQSMEPEK